MRILKQKPNWKHYLDIMENEIKPVSIIDRRIFLIFF